MIDLISFKSFILSLALIAQSINGCVIVPHAKGLIARLFVCQHDHKSSVNFLKSGIILLSAKELKIPFFPSKTVLGPLKLFFPR